MSPNLSEILIAISYVSLPNSSSMRSTNKSNAGDKGKRMVRSRSTNGLRGNYVTLWYWARPIEALNHVSLICVCTCLYVYISMYGEHGGRGRVLNVFL